MIIVRAARLDRRGAGAAGGVADSGGTYPLGDDFVILGTYLKGLSTGQLCLYGVTVSAAGLLAWSIPLRAFAGSPVPRGPAGRPRDPGARRRLCACTATGSPGNSATNAPNARDSVPSAPTRAGKCRRPLSPPQRPKPARSS